MKQVVQNFRTGDTTLEDVPCPTLAAGDLLVETSVSLISAGTERMLMDFGKAGLVSKARQQPDKVAMVLNKARTDGVLTTFEAVSNKLDQPFPLGYCNVGTIHEVAPDISAFTPGQRVVSNGKHAQAVVVNRNLCAVIPDEVSDEAAAFTVVGAIALQGIRLVAPTLGETVVVSGLGLIGLLAVQILRAHGCKVVGLDFDKDRLAMAEKFGAHTVDLGTQNPHALVETLTGGYGADAVLVAASTRSSEPLTQAAQMCRKRGRIVLVGVTGIELSRTEFYEKELSFQVSCSYGPGKLDPNYEEKGLDYPIGFVRWTEQRNFQAVLELMRDGKLDTESLISHQFSVHDVQQAYTVVGGSEPSLGILLNFPTSPQTFDRTVENTVAPVSKTKHSPIANGVRLGFVGSGNYATATLMPAFAKTPATLESVASASGVTAMHAAKKFGIAKITTDSAAMIADPDIDALVVTTRHNSHAQFVVDAIAADKAIFVEKPLGLNREEIDAVSAAYAEARDNGRLPRVMIGFNRRFSPLVQTIRKHALDSPMSMIMTVNAGAIPADHWSQDPEVGGGRIVGEACHFIDLLRYLAGAPIARHEVLTMQSATPDTVCIQLEFDNGSIGTINYFANGNKAVSKERLEVFQEGRVLQLDNFRALSGSGVPGYKKTKSWRQDKGQVACADAFVSALSAGEPMPISFEEIIEVSTVAIDCQRAADLATSGGAKVG